MPPTSTGGRGLDRSVNQETPELLVGQVVANSNPTVIQINSSSTKLHHGSDLPVQSRAANAKLYHNSIQRRIADKGGGLRKEQVDEMNGSFVPTKPKEKQETSKIIQEPSNKSAIRPLAAGGQPGELEQLYATISPHQTSTIFGQSGVNGLAGESVHLSKLSSYLLLVSLPLFAISMSAMVLFLLFRVCRKPARKQPSTSSGNLQSIYTCLDSNGDPPLSIISGAKMVDRLQTSVQVLCQKPRGDDRDGFSDVRCLALDTDDNGSERSDIEAVSKSRSIWARSIGSKGRCKRSPESSPESPKCQGFLKYRLLYDFDSSTLRVTVLEARDLLGMDLNGFSDPYVRVYLMPESKRKYEKTQVHKRTLNPVFNETFSFQISYGELVGKTLVLAVYDFDRFSRHDEIGQLRIDISSVDLATTIEEWKALRCISQSTKGQLGELCTSLRYVPSAGKFTVVVLEARQLKKMDLAGLSDPYVKLELISQGKRIKKLKTSIKKCTLNPHWNEAFSFQVLPDQIQKVELILTVVDYDRIGTSQPIGRISLGGRNHSGASEASHWNDMLTNPRRPMVRWHNLKNI